MKNIVMSNDVQKDDRQLPSILPRLVPWGPVFQLFELDLGHGEAMTRIIKQPAISSKPTHQCNADPCCDYSLGKIPLPNSFSNCSLTVSTFSTKYGSLNWLTNLGKTWRWNARCAAGEPN